jgi:conjugative transfer signal peptidase TraF
MKSACLILSVPLVLVLSSLIGGLAGYRINLTASMPLGIWKKSTVIQVGSYIAACIPPDTPAAKAAIERGYIPPGQCPGGLAPLLKRVAALPGDSVYLTDEAVYINGSPLPNSRTQAVDSKKRSIPPFPRGNYRVLPGQCWLFATTHPNSFDSRYFGPVQESSVVNSLLPVATFEPAEPQLDTLGSARCDGIPQVNGQAHQ